MAANPLPRLRRLCLALPEAHEVVAWGEPTFRVRKKMFATFASASNHHGRGRHAAWVKALPVNQDLLVRSAPQRVFVPPYVGPSGWIGMYLDEVADWVEVARLLREGYRLVAPKRLLAQLENDGVVDRQPAVKSILPKRPPRSRGNRQGRT
jgi:predicted DNA-binding protein (MmcQ/YjbR family)